MNEKAKTHLAVLKGIREGSYKTFEVYTLGQYGYVFPPQDLLDLGFGSWAFGSAIDKKWYADRGMTVVDVFKPMIDNVIENFNTPKFALDGTPIETPKWYPPTEELPPSVTPQKTCPHCGQVLTE